MNILIEHIKKPLSLRFKALMLLGLVFLLIGGWVLFTFEKLVIYNPTSSVPTGFYHYAGKNFEIGEVVLFLTPDVVKEYTLRNHSSEGFEHFLKPILAKENDHLCFKDNKFLLNGKAFANVKTLDSRGNELPVWKECRKLSQNEVFVFSDRVENSFDSRYYGPIEINRIIGVFKRI